MYSKNIIIILSDYSFAGLFSFRTPILMLRDPALVEAVLVKDFTSFYDRGTGADTDLDPLASHLSQSVRNKMEKT
uniref:Cytochrome P450 6HE1v1 n=1 Tax=Triatoma infestans TaxID=30076 RepID=A0A170XC06_TRIIF